MCNVDFTKRYRKLHSKAKFPTTTAVLNSTMFSYNTNVINVTPGFETVSNIQTVNPLSTSEQENHSR